MRRPMAGEAYLTSIDIPVESTSWPSFSFECAPRMPPEQGSNEANEVELPLPGMSAPNVLPGLGQDIRIL